MQVTLELPEDLAQLLGENSDRLSRVALETLALEGLRAGKITVAPARRLLGIASRYEMDGFLKSHGVMLPLNVGDVERDAEPLSASEANEGRRRRHFAHLTGCSSPGSFVITSGCEAKASCGLKSTPQQTYSTLTVGLASIGSLRSAICASSFRFSSPNTF